MDVRARLTRNMQALRRERGWSQEELAHRAGLHRTYISGVERGVRNPTVSVLDKIAGAFEVTIGRLTDPLDTPAPP